MYVCIIVVFIIRTYVHILGLSHAAYGMYPFYIHTEAIPVCMYSIHTGVLCSYKCGDICICILVCTSVGSAGGGLSRSCPQASPVGPESKEEQNCKFALSACVQIMTEAQFRVLWSPHLVVPFDLCSPQMMTERYSTSLPTTAY